MSQFSENENWYVCSIVVQARPEKLNQVKEAILAIPTAEIHGESGLRFTLTGCWGVSEGILVTAVVVPPATWPAAG